MDQNEVVNNTGEQESQEEPTNKMEALLAQEGLTIDFPKRGEIRKGTIASISDTQILVSVGAKSEGILTGKELDSIDAETRQSFEVGEEIAVYIINPEDANGNLILSYTRALEEENWQKAEELLESKDSFTSKIEGFNKGGLLVPLGTIRGFVPASQIGLSRRLTLTGNSPEERYAEMVGETIDVCVIEVDRDRRRLILSERAASSDTRDTIKERVIDELKEGEIRSGRVTSLADFGAFVNINGADGLVHLSELSWEHVNHPSEILEVGQEIKVKVISVDVDRKRIGLSIRRLEDDPWNEQVENLTEGQLVEGKITRLTNFGAFARLLFEDQDKDLEGLIHISEISETRIEHPKEVLHEGDVVTLRVIKIEEDTHRIGLSLRRVDSPAYTDLDWKALTEELDVSDLSGALDEETAEGEAQEPQIEAETTTPIAEAESEEVITEEPEAEEPVAEAEMGEADLEEPLLESKAEEMDAEEPVAEAEMEETDLEKPLLESEAEEMDAEEPVAEAETEEVDLEEPPVETEAEEMDAEEPAVEVEAEVAEIEEPLIEEPATEGETEEPQADTEEEA